MTDTADPVTGIECPVYLQYHFTAGRAPARFLTRIKEGVLSGQRCPRCSNVYIPPRGSCPACGVPWKIRCWREARSWSCFARLRVERT